MKWLIPFLWIKLIYATELSVSFEKLPSQHINWNIQKEIEYIEATHKYQVDTNICFSKKLNIELKDVDLSSTHLSKLNFDIQKPSCHSGIINAKLRSGTSPFDNISTPNHMAADLIEWDINETEDIISIQFKGSKFLISKLLKKWNNKKNLAPYFKMYIDYLSPVILELNLELTPITNQQQILQKAFCTETFMEVESCPYDKHLMTKKPIRCTGVTSFHKANIDKNIHADLIKIIPNIKESKVITHMPCQNNVYVKSLGEELIHSAIENSLRAIQIKKIPLFLPRSIILEALK